MEPAAQPLGFGITAGERPGLEELGPQLERLGYAELWSNDTRAGSGLATLASTAPATSRLRLAVGVIALSERAPQAIAEEIARLGLPRDRLVVGVGSGHSASVALVREGVAELRRLLPGVPLAVAAMGPRMCRLAGEVADVALLNWILPSRVAWSRARIAEGAGQARRPAPRVAAYVRVAIGVDATARLAREAERYRAGSKAYRRAFAAQGTSASTFGVAVSSAAGLRARLEAYRAVLDTVVVRGLPARDEVGAWLDVAAAAAGTDGPG